MAIRHCSCYHKFQDETYGKGMRVFNKRDRKGKRGWRCTICGRIEETKEREVVDEEGGEE